MKLKYLGTAAAEGWPAVFCNCDYCNKARERGGKSIRTRSQAMVNDDMLIDFPADTYHHALVNNLNLSKIKHTLITHTHSDHFIPVDLAFRGICFAHNLISEKITFIGNEAMNSLLKEQYLKSMYKEVADKIESVYLPLFKPTQFGDYTITALHANHKTDEIAYVYVIQKDNKTMLYLHDTGFLAPENHEYLKNSGIIIDLISYDCTFVLGRDGNGHLGLPDCIELREQLFVDGIVSKKTVHVINHFSHNGGTLHEELEAEAAKSGFLTSYDCMEIEI
ncbi:MAG: hypothetical protein A2Y17_05685 [Clostridiales bacterium GWF2_38_85]|nr:MAG: hypothetical protein A2Y17_05685 [Clostridiales bacterium GWF2_38_85]